MRRAVQEAAERLVRPAMAGQLQQQRFLNIHEYQVRRGPMVTDYDRRVMVMGHTPNPKLKCPQTLCPQGAQLMSQYGITVPPGIPVHKLEEVFPAAEKMADAEGKVSKQARACLLPGRQS